MGDNGSVLRALNGYTQRVRELLISTKDAKWLCFGLVAVSIDDLRNDFRDTLEDLGNLYVAAVHAGVAPTPYIKTVAAISNSQVRDKWGSTQSFLAGFQKSEYFSKDVGLKLRSGPSKSDDMPKPSSG